MRRRPSRVDDAIVRAAARKVALQLSLVCALLVVIVGVLAFTLIGHHHEPAAVVGAGRGPSGDDDDLVLDGLLIAGAVGVVIAGLVGWVAARNAVRPLGRALSLQRRFIADAGHELRTPLTILHTRAQLLARRLPVDDPQHEIADQLVADSRVLGDIIEELLLSAQLENNPSLGEQVDLADIATDVIRSIVALAHPAGIELRGDLPPGSYVLGSRVALRRAIVALIDNAIAHTPAGGHVIVSCTHTTSTATLTVIDTGEGIGTADPTALLDRFSRGNPAGAGDRVFAAEQPAPAQRGRFGLGLSLVAEILRAHGGHLELTGEPGQGTRAGFTLPAAPTVATS